MAQRKRGVSKSNPSSRKGSGALEGKSAKLQEVSSVEQNPIRFSHYHHLITLAAFRYALGRRSYIVSEVVDWIIKNWSEISQETLQIIVNETEQAVMMASCGEEADHREWERFLEFAHKKSRFL